ncbi:hypothetical protein SISSUDRAFT_130703 [Sistotremastrum suecicum HHB10207 ss-3]|uniref:Uncharacterized protein n=1 Tax=Sistotremastrum suecicum HHB10207 ss-3 TaxID=1314776 RepID=A0A166AXI2_9AGAM|nr:hypothetical protein SISSUDRAFT_130703 [Sistotremastrum suecicum HHB10207 ss-3]
MQHKSAAANRAAKSNNNHNSKYMSCITSFIIHAFARYPPHFAAVNDPKAAPPHEHANALTIIGLMLTALALFMMEVCGIEPRYLGFTDKHRIPTGRKVLYQVIATIPCTLQYFGHLLALSGAMLFYWNLWSVVLLGWLLLFCILYMLCCALGIHNKWQSAAKEIDDWLKKSR